MRARGKGGRYSHGWCRGGGGGAWWRWRRTSRGPETPVGLPDAGLPGLLVVACWARSTCRRVSPYVRKTSLPCC